MPAFDDQNLPYAPNDHLPKPEVGDVLVNRDQSSLADIPKRGKVVHLFDTLGDDWGISGELAWAQADINEQNGHKGRWYAICEDTDDEYYGTWSVASYEVQTIVGK